MTASREDDRRNRGAGWWFWNLERREVRAALGVAAGVFLLGIWVLLPQDAIVWVLGGRSPQFGAYVSDLRAKKEGNAASDRALARGFFSTPSGSLDMVTGRLTDMPPYKLKTPSGREYLGAIRPEDSRRVPSGVFINPSRLGGDRAGSADASAMDGRAGAPAGRMGYIDGRFPAGKANAVNTPPWLDRAVAGAGGTGGEGAGAGGALDNGSVPEDGDWFMLLPWRQVRVHKHRQSFVDRIKGWLYHCDATCSIVELVTQEFADETAFKASTHEQATALAAVPYDGKSQWNLWGNSPQARRPQPFDGASVPMTRAPDEAQDIADAQAMERARRECLVAQSRYEGPQGLASIERTNLEKSAGAMEDIGCGHFWVWGGARELCDAKRKEYAAACLRLDQLLLDEYSSCPLRQRTPYVHLDCGQNESEI